MGLGTVPEWLAAALVGAALAALGFVGKQILEWFVSFTNNRRVRRARLVTLLSLLNGTQAVFRVQKTLRDRLFKSVIARKPDLAQTPSGYEAVFSAAFRNMNDEEKDLHSVIRGYTANGLKPLNEAIRTWLREDTEFKLPHFRDEGRRQLAGQLADLEAHLLMWLAKYEAWMPNPAHALVYLADEELHGVPFPTGIEHTIERVLGIPASRPGKLQQPSAADVVSRPPEFSGAR